jgi:hypothetical protein
MANLDGYEDVSAHMRLRGALTFDELAAHGARETTKLLVVKPRLKCTRCGGQYADLQPDCRIRTAGRLPEFQGEPV